MRSLYQTFHVYLAFMRKSFQERMCADIASIQEPDIEALIKTVYEDNLTFERKLAEPEPTETNIN